jgi:hypothetical protein
MKLLCWYWCPEIGPSSIDWAKLCKFYLKTEIESSFRNVVFLNKNRMIDNVQKHNICKQSILRHEFSKLIFEIFSSSIR